MPRFSLALLPITLIAMLSGCTTSTPPTSATSEAEIPPQTKAWMDRLTVQTSYDPKTGFIVAREVIELPRVLRDAPKLPEAIEEARGARRPVLVFATADRCGPCQQYKKDAINDPRVVAWMEQNQGSGVIATHVEVDREKPSVALLPSPAIPMTYWMVDGKVVESLRGQRTADDLLAFLARRP